jgi:hypothetical protein
MKKFMIHSNSFDFTDYKFRNSDVILKYRNAHVQEQVYVAHNYVIREPCKAASVV